jgi:helix-turn-helix protein
MQLVRALLNSTRIRILDAVAKCPASVRQLAATLDESPGVVSYHVGVLRETGCLQPTMGEQAGPGAECIYELAPLATPTRRLAQQQASSSVISHPSAAILRMIVDKGTDDLEVGPLTGRNRDHLSCFSIVLDRQGWREVSAAIGNALDRVSIVHEESARRLAETDEEGISATVAVASFESREAV